MLVTSVLIDFIMPAGEAPLAEVGMTNKYLFTCDRQKDLNVFSNTSDLDCIVSHLVERDRRYQIRKDGFAKGEYSYANWRCFKRPT